MVEGLAGQTATPLGRRPSVKGRGPYGPSGFGAGEPVNHGHNATVMQRKTFKAQNFDFGGSSPPCRTNFMAKVTTKKAAQKQKDPLLIEENVYLPDELARIAQAYYEAFLKKGFGTVEAFSLTKQVVDSYLRT